MSNEPMANESMLDCVQNRVPETPNFERNCGINRPLNERYDLQTNATIYPGKRTLRFSTPQGYGFFVAFVSWGKA